jgi:hypothetical protein
MIKSTSRFIPVWLVAFRHMANGGEQTFLGGFNVARMDIHGSPVTNGVILMGGDGNDAKLGEVAKERVANVGTFAVLLGRYDEEIGGGLLDMLVDVRLVGHFANDLDPRLLRKRLEKQFPHQFGFVGDQDPERSDHFALTRRTSLGQ